MRTHVAQRLQQPSARRRCPRRSVSVRRVGQRVAHHPPQSAPTRQVIDRRRRIATAHAWQRQSLRAWRLQRAARAPRHVARWVRTHCEHYARALQPAPTTAQRARLRHVSEHRARRHRQHGSVIVRSRAEEHRRPFTRTCTVRWVMCAAPRSMPDHDTVLACTSMSEANTLASPTDDNAGRSTTISTAWRAITRVCKRRASLALNDVGVATMSTSNPSTRAATVATHSRLARGGCANTMRSTATPASIAAAMPRFGTPTTANHDPAHVAAALKASAVLNAASPAHATVRPRTRPVSPNSGASGATTGNGARTVGAPRRVRRSVVTPSP